MTGKFRWGFNLIAILPFELPISRITSWQLVVILDQGGFFVAISMIMQPKLQMSTAEVKVSSLFTISGAVQKGASN